MKIGRISLPISGTWISMDDVELTDEEAKIFGEQISTAPRPTEVKPVKIRPISCHHQLECTDYPEKCETCANNKAKSYYT